MLLGMRTEAGIRLKVDKHTGGSLEGLPSLSLYTGASANVTN